jgi:enoyl-CoA hydratase
MSYETLLYEHSDHVVTLTYNRPDQHNAVNRTMNAELHDAWQRFRDDDDAFVLVITGAGDTTFCAGWDLQDAAELEEIGDYDAFRISLYNGMTVRLPLVVGFARAMELVITGRRIDVQEAHAIGLVSEIVPRGRALERAQQLAHEIAGLPQGAIRSDKESIMRGVGRTLEERLRIEAEMTLSMFMRRDPHTLGAAAFKAGNLAPEWPHHGL